MMIGAVGWGTISDLLGRALPFNSTLFLTAVFGIGASFSPSFPILCVWMFFLGSAVGYVRRAMNCFLRGPRADPQRLDAHGWNTIP